MRQRLVAGFMGLLLFCALLAGCRREEPVPETWPETVQAHLETLAATEAVQPETAPQEERFWLTFAGDCTFGSNAQNQYAQVGFPQVVGEDYGWPFRSVLPYFSGDELTCVNLEGPLCEGGWPAIKTHVFKGKPEYTAILTEGSVELVTLANNHSRDQGLEGYLETKSHLENAGVGYVEAGGSTILKTEHDLTVGLYGASYDRLDREAICAGVAELDQTCDVVIFAVHWGEEGDYVPSDVQKMLGRAVIDAGADIVWGSHPHCLQPVEVYGGGVIFYSLGNFSFGGNAGPRDMDTAILRQEVIRRADGTVALGAMEAVPCSISSRQYQNDYQPTPYEKDSPGYGRVLEKLNLPGEMGKKD